MKGVDRNSHFSSSTSFKLGYFGQKKLKLLMTTAYLSLPLMDALKNHPAL